MANDNPRVSRRRLLGGSASLAALAALAGCIEDENIDEFLDESDDDPDDRRDDRRDDDEPREEPDDPPETVADGFDLDAALAATVDALYDSPVALGGVTTFLSPDDEDREDGDVDLGVGLRGDPETEVGRLRTLSGPHGALDGIDPEADIDTDVDQELLEDQDEFVRDDEYARRLQFDAEPNYDVQSGSYPEMLTLIENVLEWYHEVGQEIAFDDPRWDSDRGRYLVEGERFDGDDPGTDDLSLLRCTAEIDTEGVVVAIDAELEGEAGGRFSQDAAGEYDRPVTVPEPDWLDEAAAAADDPDDEPDDGTDDDAESIRDATGQATAVVAVGAGADGLAFDPTRLRIDPGTTVVWEWTGEGGAHTVTAVDGEFDSGDPVGEAGHVFEHRFTEPGTYEYLCRPHQGVGMRGQIEVVDD